MRKLKFVFIFILIISLLTACYTLDPEEKVKMNELVNEQSENFIKQAKIQYGNNIKVHDIRVEERIAYHPVWIGATIYSGDNLLGVVKGKAFNDFNAMYFPSENIITSDKNVDKITQSAIDDLESSKLKILDIQIRNSARKVHMLADEIISYEDIVDNGEYTTIRIVTNSDISELKLIDFDKIFKVMARHENEPHILNVEIVQINDIDKASKLGQIWSSQGMNFYRQLKYAWENDSEHDIEIEKYSVVASMDVRSYYGGQLEYMNIDGEEIVHRMSDYD